jgi:hypothetical protein
MERGLWAGPQGEKDCLHKEAGARSGAHTRTKIRVKLEFTAPFALLLLFYCLQLIKIIVRKVE